MNNKHLLNGEMACQPVFLVQEVFDSSKLPKASTRNTPASSLGAPASSLLVPAFFSPLFLGKQAALKDCSASS
ncbi:unnamed protein product [Gulo gulo]|uniref:Uncharacterized protein n=1 Tax=Gulo gulo TaxID=48420 RepID=A0A9X9LXC1_GULGU|nr:unnamed protein product [Gulo gulo]